jgi:hypothetical protein
MSSSTASLSLGPATRRLDAIGKQSSPRARK